jgi:hypothetical protein
MDNVSGKCNWHQTEEQKPKSSVVIENEENKVDPKEIEKMIKNVVSSHKKYKQHIEELYEKTQKKEYYDILISIQVLDKDISNLN